MRKFFSQGLMAIAGLVSLPLGITPGIGSGHTMRVPPPDYRQDPRFHSLRSFFQKFGCPAWEYAHVFLEAADDYSLDWRLLPSLSMVETGGGKGTRNNNLFGWNCGRTSFRSPKESIHTIAAKLSQSKLYKGKDTNGILKAYNTNPRYGLRVKAVMETIGSADPAAVAVAAVN